jgi:type IV secretory pathway VirB4 component
MPKPISTQEHIPISAIYDDVVVTKKGQFSQILMVNSVNFGLKSEEEQNAIIYQYQSFLNSLSFPIQITMHSKQLDLTAYIKDLKDRIAQEPNELIRYQIQEYVDFVEKLISIANIMDKKFFITIPYQLPPNEMPREGFFASLFGSSHIHLKVPLKKFTTIKDELQQRVNTVVSGLASMGISAQALTTKQLIELFYRTYNPEEAMREKIKGDVEAIGVQTEQAQATAQKAQAGIVKKADAKQSNIVNQEISPPKK